MCLCVWVIWVFVFLCGRVYCVWAAAEVSGRVCIVGMCIICVLGDVGVCVFLCVLTCVYECVGVLWVLRGHVYYMCGCIVGVCVLG